MGLADAFILLGVAYDSDEAVDLGRRIQAFIDEEAKRESERLATIRGVFPEWERSIWGPDETCARGPNGERIRPMRKLRNCNVTTVAPPAPSPSSRAAARGSSRYSPWRSCVTRPAC
jgi:ribonucleoside-diphosphate reductase alpha chain